MACSGVTCIGGFPWAKSRDRPAEGLYASLWACFVLGMVEVVGSAKFGSQQKLFACGTLRAAVCSEGLLGSGSLYLNKGVFSRYN